MKERGRGEVRGWCGVQCGVLILRPGERELAKDRIVALIYVCLSNPLIYILEEGGGE